MTPTPPQAAPSEADERTVWRCFHCDEVFTDRAEALDHFGASEHQRPACHIDIKHVRWLEEQHRRNVADDTETLRTIRGLAGEHETLRRRAEEEGYARGLADARKNPEELGLRAQAAAPAGAQPVVYVPHCIKDCDDGVEGEYRFAEWDEKPFAVSDPEHWTCAPLYPSAQAQAQPDPVLCKFYQVDSFPALVAAMEHHIERLQAKLPKNDQPAFTRVREG